MAATAAMVFAGKSVATPAISFIINKAFGYLRDWHQAEGMEAVKHRLERRLTEIQAVYDAVSLQQIDEQKGRALNQWLWRFRDAVEGAEDALDEVDYYKLEEDAHPHPHPQNLQHQIQVRNPVTRFFRERVFRRFVRHTSEGNMVKKLRKAIQDLDGVAEGVCTFLQLVSRFDSCALHDRAESSDQQTKETGSTLEDTEIFGRNKEKNEIIMWLTNNSDEGSSTCRASTVPVFAIIGIGGIGKTTLAKLVCRDLKDRHRHFQKIVWVHVSNNTFSTTKITKKILDVATKNRPNADTLEALQQLLKEEIKGKKVLLILDDVWEDGREEDWKTLMAPLQASQTGSRVLLTTRMQSVADTVTSVMQCKKEYLPLGGLDEDDNFTLFQKVAFKDMEAEDYTHLLPIAKEIVKKFQGCPLVTNIAGADLKKNLSKQYWKNLNTELEQLNGKLDIIITKVLRSSYQHLPEDLQVCFRYCSIFPKDCTFKKDELVKMWMCSGLIPQVEGGTERPEDIGERYLAQLTKKSFFSFVPTGDPYNKHYSGYYIMHDLLHDLSRSVSFGECLRLESGDHMYDRHTVRHLWIADFSKLTIEETDAISFFKNLRTLVIESSSDLGMARVYALEKVVENLKGLRLLVLKRVPKFCFAKEVSKHLRYVSLSGMQQVQGLSKLYHLQILIADRSVDIEPEQLAFGNLSRLRYVSSGFGELFVARLISLQELHNFQIQAKEGYKISSLQNLSSLCKLKMCNLENIGNHEEVIEARLNEKDHLKSLSLNWSVTNGSPRNEDGMIIEKLQPPARLENLEIAGYNGFQFPSWINHFSLKNMMSLELRKCRNLVSLPALGNLRSLKHLELQNMTKLEQIGQSSDGSLPPNLRTLVMEDCGNLWELPLLPSSLVQLEINKVGLIMLPSMCDHHDNKHGFPKGLLPKLLSVIISNCLKLTSLEGSFLLQEHCVQAIRILNIIDCKNLTCAPLLFGEMNDLTEFSMGNNYFLRMPENIGGGLLPKTLKELSMERCGSLELPLLNSLLGLTNLNSLSLRSCSKVLSLPSSEVFSSLTALREMFITDCFNLKSLGGLGALPYLTWLEITDCDKLRSGEVYENHRPQVYTLWIEWGTMLEMEPLKRLHNVKNLIISSGSLTSQQWLQQNSTSLESLEILKPFGIEQQLQLQDLSSLKKLEFDRVRDYLPFPILPSSLEFFIVRMCERRVLDDWTSEWPTISCIPHVRIGYDYYRFGEQSEPF